jgi:hypothetical protein
MTWIIPPQYLCLDIETISGDPCEAEEWVRRCWTPAKNWKPATIGARYLEMVAKKEERLALLDTCPILSVQIRTEADIRVLHWMPIDEERLSVAAIERYADEPAMLGRLAELLGSTDSDTLLIGHNVKRFDLPKLRRGFLKHGIRLPACLVYRDQQVYDTMREWGRFTLDERLFIGLSELLDACGIPSHKDLLDGAHVPQLYEEGRYKEILVYAIADVIAEWNVFLRMTGQANGVVRPRETPPVDESERIAAAAAAELAVGPKEMTNEESQMSKEAGNPKPESEPKPVVEAGDDLDALLSELGV